MKRGVCRAFRAEALTPEAHLRTGAPWRELPPRFGAWATVASRFYRWRKAGIWQRILERLHQQGERAGRLPVAQPHHSLLPHTPLAPD